MGELGIWTGIWGLAALSGALSWPAVLLSTASPIGTYFLTRYVRQPLHWIYAHIYLTMCGQVSGVPPLERASNKKFGDDPKWKEYKR